MKILGYIVLSIPFIGWFIVACRLLGWIEVFKILAIVSAIFLCTSTGMWLIRQ